MEEKEEWVEEVERKVEELGKQNRSNLPGGRGEESGGNRIKVKVRR